MSVPYEFIEGSKQYSDVYFSAMERPSVLRLLQDYNCSPPSYSAVLAEKYHQSQQVQEIRESQELDTLLYSMRKSMQDTELLISSYKYYYQRLALQNQFFLQKLQESSEAACFATTRKEVFVEVEQECRKDADDSLNRMNQSLEKLIEEAEQSLNTHIFSTSDPDVISSSLDDAELPFRNDLQVQHRKRYLYAQWKLAATIRQLLNMMREKQQISSPYRKVNQYPMCSQPNSSNHLNNSAPPRKDVPKTLKTKPSLTSIFEDMVKDFMVAPPQRPHKLKFKVTKSKAVKYRIMFFSTALIAKSFVAKQRGRFVHQIHSKWKSRSQYNLWMDQVRLFIYTFHFIIISFKHTPLIHSYVDR
ncbi:hypothetical protein BD560DRAFT_444668 [Blakeslea trispora]|nr:hypothetical protein BD560DRAFT_444668 [Blakeslea trispora]